MLILPVIDLQRGVPVHGRGGRREAYRPVESVLATEPTVACLGRAIRERLNLRQVYLADLDAIAGNGPNWQSYQQLESLGLRCWLDAGIRDLTDAQHLRDRGGASLELIVALETLASTTSLNQLATVLGTESLVVSLDSVRGRPRTRIDAWRVLSTLEIAERLIERGIQRLILLDLARVGMGQGTGTESLIGKLRQRYPEVHLIAGGGIAHVADVRRLADQGCHGVLLASTLHDGRIGAAELAEIARW